VKNGGGNRISVSARVTRPPVNSQGPGGPQAGAAAPADTPPPATPRKEVGPAPAGGPPSHPVHARPFKEAPCP